MPRIPVTPLSPTQLAATAGGSPTLRSPHAVTIGDDADNHIETGDQRDHVEGRDGDDTLLTGGDRDVARGGSGDDWIDGGAESDVLRGETGNDQLNGGRGDGAADRLDGGAGLDVAYWGPGDGNDTFEGGDGMDVVGIHGATPAEVLAGLVLPPGVTAVLHDSGRPGAHITFTDAANRPVSIEGTLTLGADRLTFRSIDAIHFTR